MARQLPIGVLISGNGTNLQAIIDAIEARALDAKIEVVLSNKADAYGLARAQKHNLYTAVLDHKSFSSREAYDQAVVDILRRCNVELVVLAGFMRLLSPLFIKAYSNRIMNIHPALLPAFPACACRRKRSIMVCDSPVVRFTLSMMNATKARSLCRRLCRSFRTTAKAFSRPASSSKNIRFIPGRFSFTPNENFILPAVE